ncbi:MAG: DUF4194 domain-containing protein [Bacteroidetes bacterium]|nr:DUF4194 domain-containing protein [Bacteroidota bacterium]
MATAYSPSLIALLKGIVYSHQKDEWENLLQHEADLKKYVSVMGLELYLDVSEGYAYLRQHEPQEGEPELPRLAEKRQLNLYTSLLVLILRKYLLEHDAQGGSLRSIISREDIINRVKVFLPVSSDEVKIHDKIATTINKVIDLGFLRKLEDGGQNYEIHRILKGFVNAEVVDDTLKRLQQYAAEKEATDTND